MAFECAAWAGGYCLLMGLSLAAPVGQMRSAFHLYGPAWWEIWSRNSIIGAALMFAGLALGTIGPVAILAVEGLLEGLSAGAIIKGLGLGPWAAGTVMHLPIEMLGLSYLGAIGVVARGSHGSPRLPTGAKAAQEDGSPTLVSRLTSLNPTGGFVLGLVLLAIAAAIEAGLSGPALRAVTAR